MHRISCDPHILSGFVALSSLDAGFYGKGKLWDVVFNALTQIGIYFSSSARYISPYYLKKDKPAILICYAIPGNPYPCIESPKSTKSLVGSSLKAGYNSHYVLVTMDGMPCEKQMQTNYYDELGKNWQISIETWTNCFEVLDQESLVMPAFIIEPDVSTIHQALSPFERELPGENTEIL